MVTVASLGCWLDFQMSYVMQLDVGDLVPHVMDINVFCPAATDAVIGECDRELVISENRYGGEIVLEVLSQSD